MDGFDYNIIFDNSSSSAGTMILYQLFPENKVTDAYPVVWFSKLLYPDTKAYFSWNEEFNVIWSETGTLEPGIKCFPNQSKNVNPEGKNLIDLNYDQTYYLSEPINYRVKENLFIRQSCNIPLSDDISVGIGMVGKPTFITQVTSCSILEFSTKVEYWVAFGNYSGGLVLDPVMIMNAKQVVFPMGVNTMAVSLDQNNRWKTKAGL